MNLLMGKDGTLDITLDPGQRLHVTIAGAEVEITNGVVGGAGPAPEISIATETDTDYELSDSQGVGIRKADECETIHVRIVPISPESEG